MQIAMAMAVGAAALFGGAFTVNEMTHGTMSEAMGLGHHHMLDWGGEHCVSHTDVQHLEGHMAHMHPDNSTRPHENCPGGPGMHGNHTVRHHGDG